MESDMSNCYKRTKTSTLAKLDHTIPRPDRVEDYTSKRGVKYWWSPEWVHDLNGTIGRIKPISSDGDVFLHIINKDGNATYIQGSIQQAFKSWHIDRQIDYILLGVDEEDDFTPNWEK
jgi:hypothetical protein